jgi:hypothetical protein
MKIGLDGSLTIEDYWYSLLFIASGFTEGNSFFIFPLSSLLKNSNLISFPSALFW